MASQLPEQILLHFRNEKIDIVTINCGMLRWFQWSSFHWLALLVESVERDQGLIKKKKKVTCWTPCSTFPLVLPSDRPSLANRTRVTPESSWWWLSLLRMHCTPSTFYLHSGIEKKKNSCHNLLPSWRDAVAQHLCHISCNEKPPHSSKGDLRRREHSIFLTVH